jgi:hypothetical protein
MVFVELPLFQKLISFSDEDLRRIQNAILEHPEAGDVMVKGKGLRKLRVALPGRGKSGGARVIYYWCVSASLCLLMFAYPKNAMDTLSDEQLKALVHLVEEEFGNG